MMNGSLHERTDSPNDSFSDSYFSLNIAADSFEPNQPGIYKLFI